MTEENKNQNISQTPQTEQASQPQKQEIKNPGQQEEYLFFNVAPKINSKDSLVSPSQNISKPPVLNADNLPVKPKISVGMKLKSYLIGLVVIIIGGGAVYFAIQKFGSVGIKPDNLLVNNSAIKPPSQNLAQPANFTTAEDWRKKYFPECSDEKLCGDLADPESDGFNNLQEFKLQTDPNNPDSDGDMLADGDEVNIFSTDPLNINSGNPKYTDLDDLKNGYHKSAKMSPEQMVELGIKASQTGIHEPTISSLGPVLEKNYGYIKPNLSSNNASSTPINASTTAATTSPLSQLDQTAEAKQERDAQRSNTIKMFEIALVKYKDDTGKLPDAMNFEDMYSLVKPYLKIATNPKDPINQDPYIYSYSPNTKGDDFVLSFFSESANQLIKKRLADAIKDKATEEANIYDDQRKTDLANLQSALLLYSNANIAGNQDYVFPTVEKYKTELVPKYLSAVPKDPKTLKDYEYKPSEKFDTFTLKSVLDNPPAGTTGYMCNQEECRGY